MTVYVPGGSGGKTNINGAYPALGNYSPSGPGATVTLVQLPAAVPAGTYLLMGQAMVHGATVAGALSLTLAYPGTMLANIDNWIPVDANLHAMSINCIATTTAAQQFMLQAIADATLTGVTIMANSPHGYFGTGITYVRLA